LLAQYSIRFELAVHKNDLVSFQGYLLTRVWASVIHPLDNTLAYFVGIRLVICWVEDIIETGVLLFDCVVVDPRSY